MGSNPEGAARRAGKKARDMALEQQEKLYNTLVSQQKEFLGEGAPQNYAQAIKEIIKAPGTSMADYINRSREEFRKGTDKVTNQYRSDIAKFQQQPRILGGPVYGMLRDDLRDMTQEYARGVTQLGERGRDRFFALPEQARIAFTASSESPAFNNLKNQEYMAYATGKVPGMTISNDANAMYRPQYTYNV